MKRLAGMFVVASFLLASRAGAIDITIAPGATMQIGANNTITISPITLNTPLPVYPAGNYSVTFQWHPGANALIPIGATRVGGGGTTTGGAVGHDLNGVLIESETFVTDTFLSACTLRVQVFNRTAQLKSTVLFYNAFDAAGQGIGFASLFKLVPPNGRATLESQWVSPASRFLRCSEIARYELDLTISSAP